MFSSASGSSWMSYDWNSEGGVLTVEIQTLGIRQWGLWSVCVSVCVCPLLDSFLNVNETRSAETFAEKGDVSVEGLLLAIISPQNSNLFLRLFFKKYIFISVAWYPNERVCLCDSSSLERCCRRFFGVASSTFYAWSGGRTNARSYEKQTGWRFPHRARAYHLWRMNKFKL